MMSRRTHLLVVSMPTCHHHGYSRGVYRVTRRVPWYPDMGRPTHMGKRISRNQSGMSTAGIPRVAVLMEGVSSITCV